MPTARSQAFSVASLSLRLSTHSFIMPKRDFLLVEGARLRAISLAKLLVSEPVSGASAMFYFWRIRPQHPFVEAFSVPEAS